MPLQASSDLALAQQLMRNGRFLKALSLLENYVRTSRSDRTRDFLAEAILADALQRNGSNQRAQDIAVRNLPRVKACPQLAARYHFVLGNIDRERGRNGEAISHFRLAVDLAGSDLELACWSHLRLIRAIAEFSGTPAAFTHLDEVKRCLARFGDARAFATLHLWFVEAESTRGNLENARHHLQTAESLLADVEDVWLRGYFAINSCALHYYSANTAEAQRSAELAITYARESGHRPTLLAGYANLGNIALSHGDLPKAEHYFRIALKSCEPGSVNEIAILDSLAQIKLQLNELNECHSLVLQLEELVADNDYAKHRHYNSSALLTKTRLLLQEGKKKEALQVTQTIKQLLATMPKARMSAEAHLLSVETLLANDDGAAAVDNLVPVLSPCWQLSPDQFARMEEVTGQTLASSDAFDLARVHLERSISAFAAIGHVPGIERSRKELASIPTGDSTQNATLPQRSLDRLRALLDLRKRPELFGQEAVSLLEELECAEAITLTAVTGASSHVLKHIGPSTEWPSNLGIAIPLSTLNENELTLSFLPLKGPQSRITAAVFERVLRQILSIPSVESPAKYDDIVWTSNAHTSTRHGIVFASEVMFAILRTLNQIAVTDVSVLLTGETGTGKEVIARTIHDLSHRSQMPFLALNCAAVPKDLLESHLFGHRKGAFSGASESHQGMVRAANDGTLFLDEVGELPLDTQAKLLRFLELSEVHPLGEAYPVKVNVRLIFATNNDLEEAVTQGRFRRDLFYRLNVLPLRIPPLRERRDDIPVLTSVFAQRFAKELSKDPIQLSSGAMERLILFPWPGNVRELANEIRRLAVLNPSGAYITPEELSASLQASKKMSQRSSERGPHVTLEMNQSLETATAVLETEMIKNALRQASGNMASAAAILGISRKGLYLKRLRLGLSSFSEIQPRPH